MTTIRAVEAFLADFHSKMKIWNVFYLDDRGKNTQTLADLELRSADRTKILENLKASDYSEGPLVEQIYGGRDMWVFGKEVKKHEVYIKITLGSVGCNVLCISFHIAEHPMNYPLK